MSMLTGQELFCFLHDYVLTRPTEDKWQSIKDAVSTFLDCWTSGKVEFEQTFCDKVIVKIDNKVVFEFYYRPVQEKLGIKWFEDGDEYNNNYCLRWSN
jgi:hypothetical protein